MKNFDTLECGKAILRPYSFKYIPLVYNMIHSNPNVTVAAGYKPYSNIILSYINWFSKLFFKSNRIILVFDKDDNFHGILSYYECLNFFIIGIAFAQRMWGKGLSRDATSALVNHLRFSYGKPVYAIIDVNNHHSQRLVRDIGFEYCFSNNGKMFFVKV